MLAIIPKDTQVFSDTSIHPIITPRDILVDVRIIYEDIEVAEFTYNGVVYTVYTKYIIWLNTR